MANTDIAQLSSPFWNGVAILGNFLGPFLAAFVTGGLLIFQNARRAQEERNRAEEKRKEARSKNLAKVRAEWVSSFQEALLAASSLLDMRIQGVGLNSEKEKCENAASKMHVANARLHLVERDRFIRATAYAYGLSVVAWIHDDRDVDDGKLGLLSEGFRLFMDELAGIGTTQERKEDRQQIVQSFWSGSTLAQEEKEMGRAEMVKYG